MKQRFFSLALPIVTLTALLCTPPAHAFFGLFDGTTSVTPKDGTVTVKSSGIKPGEALFYELSDKGVDIRFFLTRDPRGVLHAALDACDVCWKEGKGYKLGEKAMICINCGMKFPLARLGQKKGGCNPHQLNMQESDGNAILSAEEILAGAPFFTGIKS